MFGAAWTEAAKATSAGCVRGPAGCVQQAGASLAAACVAWLVVAKARELAGAATSAYPDSTAYCTTCLTLLPVTHPCPQHTLAHHIAPPPAHSCLPAAHCSPATAAVTADTEWLLRGVSARRARVVPGVLLVAQSWQSSGTSCCGSGDALVLGLVIGLRAMLGRHLVGWSSGGGDGGVAVILTSIRASHAPVCMHVCMCACARMHLYMCVCAQHAFAWSNMWRIACHARRLHATLAQGTSMLLSHSRVKC